MRLSFVIISLVVLIYCLTLLSTRLRLRSIILLVAVFSELLSFESFVACSSSSFEHLISYLSYLFVCFICFWLSCCSDLLVSSLLLLPSSCEQAAKDKDRINILANNLFIITPPLSYRLSIMTCLILILYIKNTNFMLIFKFLFTNFVQIKESDRIHYEFVVPFRHN